MTVFRAGERVRTLHFGDGVVIAHVGPRVRIQLDVQNTMIVQSANDIVRIARPSSKSPAMPYSGPAPVRSPDRAAVDPARQSIEALRFGLVPHHHLEELTIGLDHLGAWVKTRLPSTVDYRPLASEVTGPFGTGKSHAMSVVRHVARKHNYLTARVEIDGQTVSLSEPEKLLYSLWGTLAGTAFESESPLLDLYVKAVKSSRLPPRVAAVGIDRVAENFEVVKQLVAQDKLDLVGHYIDAIVTSSDEFTAQEAAAAIRVHARMSVNESAVKRMIGRKLSERSADFVHSLAGHASLAKKAGFRGLVVTIDEFELESAHLPPKQQARVRDLIDSIGGYLRGETDQRRTPLSIFFASIGDAQHEGDRFIESLVAGTPGARHTLSPLSAVQRHSLAERIFQLYAAAYSIDERFDDDLSQLVEQGLAAELSESGLTRAFIKRIIAALDRRHGPPEAGLNVA